MLPSTALLYLRRLNTFCNKSKQSYVSPAYDFDVLYVSPAYIFVCESGVYYSRFVCESGV